MHLLTLVFDFGHLMCQLGGALHFGLCIIGFPLHHSCFLFLSFISYYIIHWFLHLFCLIYHCSILFIFYIFIFCIFDSLYLRFIYGYFRVKMYSFHYFRFTIYSCQFLNENVFIFIQIISIHWLLSNPFSSNNSLYCLGQSFLNVLTEVQGLI